MSNPDRTPMMGGKPKPKPKKGGTKKPAPKSKPKKCATTQPTAFTIGMSVEGKQPLEPVESAFAGLPALSRPIANVCRLVTAAVAGALSAVLGDGSGDGTGSCADCPAAHAARPAQPAGGSSGLPVHAEIIRDKLRQFAPDLADNAVVASYVANKAGDLYAWMYGFSPYAPLPKELDGQFRRTFAPCVHLVVNELARCRTRRGPQTTGALAA